MGRPFATLALLLALAAPASAAPARLGTSLTAPAVDSPAGRVVWQPDAGSIRVLDLAGGAPARALALPDGCRPGDPAALRGDRLILACAEGSRLMDVATGATGPVPGAGAAGIGGPDSGVFSAGSVWAEGWTRDAAVFFRLDGTAVERGDGTARQLPDLDAEDLWRPLCAPLERTRSEDDEDERAFLPFAYSPPLGLDLRVFPYRALRVERCGHERALRLSRCRHACVAVHLGAGSVAWREPGRIRLYRGATRRTREWPARRFGRLAEPVPTREHLVVTTGRYGAYAVWAQRAPT
jgi:hypothetical protein